MKPRADVGGGGLAGISLAALGSLLAASGVVDFTGLIALVASILVFFGGYIPLRYKSLYTALTALLATVIAYLLALALGWPADVTAISVAFVTFAQAAFTYLGQARDPDITTTGKEQPPRNRRTASG